MAVVVVPEKWKLSKGIRDELPESQRVGAAEHLWQKSAGKCALCGEPLPEDGKNVDTDHTVARAEGEGGKTELANLYLAHRACNRSRQNLSFTLGQSLVKFVRWCSSAPRRSFGEVVMHYVKNGNQRAVVVDRSDSAITLRFGTQERTAPVFVDPATKTPYFFMDVPVAYVKNDDQSQPRYIEHDHVRTLAIDFSVHPVHEPSNCRVVPVGDEGVVDLFQFDGQHKTTAQILLGRTEVPMKFYYDPSPPMIQELVVQIQQGIKKRPLSTTDTLRKLDDVVKDRVEAFKKDHGRAPTEVELVEAQPKQDQRAFKARLLSNFEFLVMNDDELVLRDFTTTKANRLKPLTDTVLLKKLIRPLVSQELLNEPLDNAEKRDTERRTAVWILNEVADRMLTGKWEPKAAAEDENIQTRRARNFFYQGAIGWWLGDVLLVVLQYLFPKSAWKRLFQQALTPDQEEKIETFISVLCSWDIWSTESPDDLAALRSNTVSRVSEAFKGYDNTRLIQEAVGAE